MTRKFFDCKKCHTHLVSFIKHHGLFVSYIIVANLFFYSSRLMSKFATTNQHCSQESGQKNCKSAPASAWRASGCLYGREINPPTASPPPGQNKMTTQVINFANLLIKKLLRRYLRSKVSFEGLLWLLLHFLCI